MKQRLIFGVVAGALGLVLSIGPASAQGRGGANGQRQGGGRPGWGGRPGRPGGNLPGYPPGSYLVPINPTPANAAAALVERDFQIMRNSVRNPNKYLYGEYNPQYRVVTPNRNFYPSWGGGYYPGGYGYGFAYGGIGNGYGFGYGGQSPLVQQDFYYVQGGDGYGANNYGGGGGYVQAQPQQRVQPRRDTPPSTDEAAPAEGKDDFYLRGGGKATSGAAEGLTDALDDIRKAWLNGDFDRLKARIATDGKVKVFPGGQYRYSQPGSEFAGMLRGAMEQIDTLSFEFERPKSEAAGRAFVTGKHVFTDNAGKRQEVYVSYGLERIGGKWRIVEAGSAGSPIARHEEAAPAASSSSRPTQTAKPQNTAR